jgi:peptide/nickel transport system permease protein
MSENGTMSGSKLLSVSQENNNLRISEWKRVTRVMFGRSVVIGGALVILGLALVAVFAPQISPYDPYETDLLAILAPPSKAHLLGTDEVGRDLLTRIIYGSRISLLVGIVAVSIGGIIGMGLGLIAGYAGGWINTIIMRVIDALLALPPLLLMLAIAVMLGGGLLNVLIALGIGLRIILQHLLPNAFPPLLVLITINLGTAIMMEASLSFLGIGILPPTATWGAMVSSGYRFLLTNPLVSFAPGVAILLVVLAFNMVGDGLRDALDPRLRGII